MFASFRFSAFLPAKSCASIKSRQLQVALPVQVVVRLVFVHWHGGIHWGSYPHTWLGRTPGSVRNPIPLGRTNCHGLFILSKFLEIRILVQATEGTIAPYRRVFADFPLTVSTLGREDVGSTDRDVVELFLSRTAV
jgi:hypothetical protein